MIRPRVPLRPTSWASPGTPLVVAVVPAWWASPWAWVAGLLVILVLLWAVRRYELGRAELRSRLEIERLESEKLRELDRTRRQFFADVSHEFRTPLTLTLGPLDDLLDGLHGPLGADARDQIRLARRNAARVLELIDQVMELTRLEAGPTHLDVRPLDLTSFIEETTAPFRPLAERRAIRLDVALPEEPILFHGDPGQLERVVGNLLSNALKFTPRGGTVRVTVGASVARVRIVVRDNGPGIPEPDQPHIFERYYRADGVGTSHPGTGIGLALAKELVELHRGNIRVWSEAGFGSSFIVELPREVERSEHGPARDAEPAIPAE
jgi:signal transduction histidine kinase